MTSGNVSDEPIAYRDDDALERLGRHRRRLPAPRPPDPHAHRRLGGPRAAAGRPLLLRRSRGYVPARLPLPVPAARPLLACGAELKNTFCLARGDRAWVGHHIGDLQQLRDAALASRGHRALRAAVRGGARRSSPTTCTPTTSRPRTRSSARASTRVGVQHHHAHLAACLAEHGETGPAVGAIYDGTGLRHRRHRLGRRDPRRRPARLRARAGTCWPVAAARAATRGARAVADGLRLARRGRRARSPALPAALAGRVDPARWRAVARLARHRLRRAGHHEHGPALRRGRGALRPARATSPTRARRRSSSRRVADPAERGAYALAPAPRRLDARPRSSRCAADLARGRAAGGRGRALPPRPWRGGDRRGLRRGGARRADRPRRALRRRVPEPAAARADKNVST